MEPLTEEEQRLARQREFENEYTPRITMNPNRVPDFNKPLTPIAEKPWYTSKLVWLGAIQFGVGLAEVVATTPILEGSEVAGVAAMIVGAGTTILRFVTKTEIK